METPETIYHFIIVDDDYINNIVCSKMIENVIPKVDIKTFTEPAKGLEYLNSQFKTKLPYKTVLYLDINMPDITGWDFMEIYDTLDASIKEQVIVFILSSSVDQRDMEKAKNDKNIAGYFVKPLMKKNVLDTLKYF